MFHYAAKLIRVVDGDTVWLNVDLGFTVHVEICFRLLGINAPELYGTPGTAGKDAKAHLEQLLLQGALTLRSEKPLKTDKYGRWLADVIITRSDGSSFNVNQQMVTDGHAVVAIY